MRKFRAKPKTRAKGPHNSLLPAEFQGRSYVVKSFIVQPRIMLMNDIGEEETEIMGPQYGVYQAQLALTLPQFMEKIGVKLRSDGVK